VDEQKPNPPDRSGWVSPPRAFVWVALLFGIPLAFITAPFQAPDEPQHFLRAYQISEGGFLPARHQGRGGGQLPLSLVEVPGQFSYLRFHPERKTSWQQIQSAMRIPLDPNRREFIPFVTAIYSPTAYLPQAAAIAIGRQLSLPPLTLMYLARSFNLLVWVLLGYVALRITPCCHRALLLLLLMPMSLFQAASMSADATTNGLAIVFTAWILRMALNRSARTIRSFSWVGLILLSAALTLSKFAYLPLAALVLLIPFKRFGSALRFGLALPALFAANVLVIALWAPQTQGLDTVVRDRADVSAPAQIRFLRAHPLQIVNVTARTVALDGWAMARSFVGWLGSMDARMIAPFVIAYLCAMFLACWSERRIPASIPLGRWLLITLLPAALSIGSVGLLNYIYWTPIGLGHVEGLQGRYLIPLAPALVYLAWGLTQKLPAPPFNAWSSRRLNAITTAITLFASTYAIILVYCRYYVH
jgi:uncharacterized membrane protein